MVKAYSGGVISATAPTVSAVSASGFFNFSEQMQAKQSGVWPFAGNLVITYSLGAAGTGGFSSADGVNGGATIVTYSTNTLTANGGGRGFFNTDVVGAGGTASGGTTNTTGGTGRGSTGDSGCGGGGGIGGGNASHNGGAAGDNGAQSVDIDGLFAVVTSAGYTTTSPGTGGLSGSSGVNNKGSNATGFGCGGAGAGYYGGDGTNGLFGGGGGGASGFGQNWTGGNGGQGVVVVQSYNGSSYSNTVLTTGTTYTFPVGTISFKVWAIGAGGGGAGSTSSDSTSGGAGGAGGTVSAVAVGNLLSGGLHVAGVPDSPPDSHSSVPPAIRRPGKRQGRSGFFALLPVSL
jgi:hypothetical protein